MSKSNDRYTVRCRPGGIPIWCVYDRMLDKDVMLYAHEEDAVSCARRWTAKWRGGLAKINACRRVGVARKVQ